MRARWGNVSHTACSGVDNQVDDSARRARSVGVTSATPPVAEWTTTRRPRRPRPGARPPQAPPPPYASQRVVAGPAAHDQGFNQHPAGATSTRPHNSNHPWPSTAPPLRAVEHASPSRTSAAQPARQAPSTPACHAGCFRSLHVERPTASRPRTPAAKPTPVEPRTPSEPLRSGAFTMQ